MMIEVYTIEENLSILKSEVEHVIRSPKKGKSTGIGI